MKPKITISPSLVVVILMTAALVLVACGAPAAPASRPGPAAPAGPVVNSIGVELPADAAPLDQQVMRYPYNEADMDDLERQRLRRERR